MLSMNLLTTAQLDAIDRLYEFDETFVVAKMGGGKTIVTLTAIKELIDDGVLDRIVVFAPVKVVKTVWQQEAQRWEHTQGLNVVQCVGTPEQRKKIVSKMQKEKGVLLVSLPNMGWFFGEYKKDHAFDGLVIDELSKMKDGGKNFKKMRPHLKSFNWRVGLTGTPVAENFIGIFYQTFCLDCGARFGGSKQKFLDQYFDMDWNGYDYYIKQGAAEKILVKLHGLVYTVPDYRSELPDITRKNLVFDMGELIEEYKWLEQHHVLELGGYDQVADNAAVLSGKLQQLASGAIYIDDDMGQRIGVERVHNIKLAACHKLVSKLVSEGEAVIICYWYKHELDRLREILPDAMELNEKGAQELWNAGQLDVLLMQPQSASHGLQLQHGGRCMVFFSPVWSNDITEQTEARIWRKGQTKDCLIYSLLMAGTIDELIVDRVNGKKKWDKIWSDQ